MNKRLYKILSALCLALLFCTTDIYGQLDIQQLTEQQGLGNNTINDIHQDRKGFLWIGTDIGLTRYDGNFFHSYNLSKPKGREAISVYNIEETEDKYLWISGEDGLLACFNKLQEKYIPIHWENEAQQEYIHRLYSTGNTLYALLPDGLNALNVKSDGKVIELGKEALIQSKELGMVLSGQNHVLYLADLNDQLITYNTQTKKSEIISCKTWGIKSKDIQNIYPFQDYLFVCGQFEGIICYSLKNKSYRQMAKKKSAPKATTALKKPVRTKRIVCLVSDEEDRIIDEYLKKYKIENKSTWMRETILAFIYRNLDEDYPTLFNEHEMRR